MFVFIQLETYNFILLKAQLLRIKYIMHIVLYYDYLGKIFVALVKNNISQFETAATLNINLSSAF